LILYRSLALLVYTLAAAVAVYAFVTRYEEPHLQREFGEQYRAYKARTPRWLPRWPGA
jgi:protein-S-isoprenylcysteine O-methyltransferase Ste14